MLAALALVLLGACGGGDGGPTGDATGGGAGDGVTDGDVTDGDGTDGDGTDGDVTDGDGTDGDGTDGDGTDGDGTDGDGTDGDGTGGDPPVTVIDAPGYPEPRGLLPKLALSDHAFESAHFSGSGTCAACHDSEKMSVTTETGPRDVSIGTAWETSTMANAARDPYWHAVVAYELDRFPMHEEEINDTCTRCHAPMANEYAKKKGVPLRILDRGTKEDGTFEPGLIGEEMAAGDPLFDHGMDGVSCTLCHQIDPENLEGDGPLPASSVSGGYRIVDYSGGSDDVNGDRPAYGQYADPDGSYMREQAGFQAQQGAHISRSETCATCHDLNVEPVDADGVPLEDVGHFSEQANYSEWLFSDYATGQPLEASCQSCHMPKLEEPMYLAGTNSAQKRADFAEHTFLGANTVMQSMMRDFAGELGLNLGLDFDPAIERNRAFLQTAATLGIENAALVAGEDGRELAFDVKVVNESGHKLPSGYHSRRVWLDVQVIDDEGELVFESGRMNADGSIVGVAEDTSPGAWEPHHDVITSERQVQVYQSIVGNGEDVRTHSLLEGSFYLKDNRLTPKGFAKDFVTGHPAVAASFGVFGGAMGDDDFDDGSDTVSYRVRVPESGGYSVRVELRYQPFSFGHLNELFRESDRIDEVDRFRTIWAATPLKAETIDAVTAVVE